MGRVRGWAEQIEPVHGPPVFPPQPQLARLTFALVVQALASLAALAGETEPCEEGLQHGQVIAVKGQIAGETVQA